MIAVGFFVAALLLHTATAWRYGYFRDELYFIACAKHLAWGYVDQPPLVAVAAWLSAPAGYQLVALRALPILASAATVFLVVRLAAELGGGRFAQFTAGTLTLLLPAYLLLGNTLTTTSFDPFFWTLVFYITVRLLRAPPAARPRLWLAFAIAVAAGGYAKYSMLAYAAALLAGVLATAQRRVILSPFAAVAGGLVALLLAPNLAWQAAHGWPFFAVLAGDATHRPAFANGWALESRSLGLNARAFALEQLIYSNPLAAPLWLTGAIASFRLAALRDLRFAGTAYALIFLAAIAYGAKGYYIAGAYAPLLAIGAVAVEGAAPLVRRLCVAAAAAAGILAAPLSLPVLPVGTLIAYSAALGLTGRHGEPRHLVQPVFAEEFGWEGLARDVAAVYLSLPADERARTAIYADTYADAGAIDFFGPRFGLPAAISSQNSYSLWGTHGYDGETMIAIGATRVDRLRQYYRKVVLVRTSAEPLKWVVEGPAPIYICRDPVAPLATIWPHLRWYGA